MNRILFVILFLSFSSLYAQGEANIWYFGEYAGLDFNNCNPKPITGSKLSTLEGCSSFSTPNGELLFYSDGTDVWNKNHEVMPNGSGLKGDPSSSQSAMIIPKPGSTTIYYVFTVGDVSDPGFNYYTIDMDEDNGLGDVTEGPIDLTGGLFNNWTEKVAAVKGAEKGTFWVVSYVYPNFHAFEVSSNGVNETPVLSATGFNATDKRGYLKLSPDGSKLAIAHQMEDGFLLYDFDDSTGKVSNEKNLILNTEGNKPYGVEFSANSEMLYVHASNDAWSPLDDGPEEAVEHISSLFQFDTSSGNESSINNSRELIHTSNLFRGALQLGPDRKIYRTLARGYTEGIPLLGVIENPEESGVSCNYNHASVGLLGNYSMQGLPPFIASIFSQIQIIGESEDGTKNMINGQTVNLCAGDNFSIYSEALQGTARYSWYMNESPIPISTNPILDITNADISINGNYKLIVINTDLCGNRSTLEGEFLINVYDPLSISPNIQYDNCDIDEISDGFTDFNLNEISPYITNGNLDLTVSYFLSYTEADTNNNPLSPVPFNNSISSTVYARVENPIGCHSITTVQLGVSTTSFPIGYSGEILTVCDDDETIDGLHLFDLSLTKSSILSQLPLQPLTVKYYKSLIDAQLELNEIDISKEYMSTIPFLEVIYVRVENDDDGSCYDIGPYVSLRVLPRPDFEVNPEINFCLNLDSYVVLETFNPDGNYSYEWKDENGITISSQPVTTIYSGGNYTVTAYSNEGCNSFTKTIHINESNIASIGLEDVSITDDTTNNTIVIDNYNNNLGIGDYEYTLDYAFGEYQDSPVFENVEIGIHVIYVRDKNNCGVTSLEVSVIGFPKFFTPNNDGWNDKWNVKGVNSNFYTKSIVEIYDRYGKILAVIEPFNQGWDGIYNGEFLPESDYWFRASIVENDGSIRKSVGHFSLIRKIKP